MPSPMALSAAHERAMRDIRLRTANAATRLWERVAPIDDLALAEWLRGVQPIVMAGQRRAAATTDAYLAAYLSTVTGEPTAPIGVTGVFGADVRDGVPPSIVYERPVVTVRNALSQGLAAIRALEIGRARMQATVQMDVALTQRAAAREVFTRDERVVGYRRVPDGSACELCLLASTQRYHSEDLMPIHNRCGCSVEPIVGDRDPGQVIDREVLGRLKADDIEGARQIADVRLRIADHGELGPVLTDGLHHFDDLN